jgi:cell wall-associated NlpC family hydrolase
LAHYPRLKARNKTQKTAVCLLALGIVAVAPGRSAPKVIENGSLELTLKGYPPPPPPKPPATEPPRQAENATDASRKGTALSEAVGQLGMTIGAWSEIYRERDPRSRLLSRLPNGTYLAIKGQQQNWYAVLMIDGTLGWVPATSVQLLEYDVVADTRRQEAPSYGPGAGVLATSVLKEAFRYLGVRYTWGGNGAQGIDCSGLVKNVFGSCGLALPRTASQQARVGTPVRLSDARSLLPGDRLYFSVKRKSIDHTGIYIGNGYFIHASMSRGEVGVDHLSKPLYGRNLVQAMRF